MSLEIFLLTITENYLPARSFLWKRICANARAAAPRTMKSGWEHVLQLEVEDDGGSLLHVTLGLVALERDGRETIVPGGAFCRTRPGAGPGTPFFEDSSDQFQSALRELDSGTAGSERTRQLETILREAHVRDALSLWYLLLRLEPESRGLIYDRLARLLPPPSGITRDGIIALDSTMLDAWKKVVSQLWQ